VVGVEFEAEFVVEVEFVEVEFLHPVVKIIFKR